MSGADVALQNAVISHLQLDEGVQSELGPVPRVQLDSGNERPALPYMEIASHRMSEGGGSGIEIVDHQMDIAIYTNWGGREGSRNAVSAVRAALENAGLNVQGHQLVWCFVAFSDSFMLRDYNTLKGVVRIRARTTPIAET